jgi:predicted metalloendopeptidase
MRLILPKDFEKTTCKQINQVYYVTALGTSGREEKWRECVSDVDGTIGFALGAMFVKAAFHGGSKTTVSTESTFILSTSPSLFLMVLCIILGHIKIILSIL